MEAPVEQEPGLQQGSAAMRPSAKAIERVVLDPQVVGASLVLALEEFTRADTAGAPRREALRVDLARLDSERARYAKAIADAGPLETIVQAIRRARSGATLRHPLHGATPWDC